MKKAIFLTAAALAAIVSTVVSPDAGSSSLAAQERYTYIHPRTRSLPIDWRPDSIERQRYALSVSPLRLVSNGLKFDFEMELPRAGRWVGTSLQLYLAPERRPRSGYYDWDNDGNTRAWFNSGMDDYNRMWGLGTSVYYKQLFSRRGWYFSAGLEFDFYRVGVMEEDFLPYTEDRLTFYDYGTTLNTKSYFKPTAKIVIGKHFAISERCFFDLHAGLGYTHSMYKADGHHKEDIYYGWSYVGNYDTMRQVDRFLDLNGFAYRGLVPMGGFKFGVLLWRDKRDKSKRLF